MITDKKPIMFGPSNKINMTDYQPYSRKSVLHNELMIESLEQQKTIAKLIKDNCTTTISFKTDSDKHGME